LGSSAGDDAGIYRIDENFSLVQTVDVFTPCVDDPYLFGQIAAANSLSDVYAMGGKPITALSIIGFPIEKLDGSIMEKILCGGIEKLNEADCSLIGGHSINDEEIKCGFAITGLINTKKIIVRDNARPADVLVLTKPLGMGIISFAGQIGMVSQKCLGEVGNSMATLNKDASELMVKHNANACTDITGFGLMGHLVEMVRGSKVIAEIDMSKLPVFAVATECLEENILSGAIEGNQEYSMPWVKVKDLSGEKNLPILYDPQTSGGLLISLPEDDAKAFLEEMHQLGHSATAVIGRVLEKGKDKPEGEVIVINSSLQNFFGTKEEISVMKTKKSKDTIHLSQIKEEKEGGADMSCCSQPVEKTCCATPPETDLGKTTTPKAKDLFSEFLKQVNEQGLIDKRTKKLIAIALSVAQRCEPCLKIHIKGAIEMGISKEEIDESAYLAISFSGSPAMMFYNEICKEMAI